MNISKKLILASLAFLSLAACSSNSSGGGGESALPPAVATEKPDIKLDGKSPQDYFTQFNYQIDRSCTDNVIYYKYLHGEFSIPVFGIGEGNGTLSIYLASNGTYHAYYVEFFPAGDGTFTKNNEKWINGTMALTEEGTLKLDGLGTLTAADQKGDEGVNFSLGGVSGFSSMLSKPLSLIYDTWNYTDLGNKPEVCPEPTDKK